MSKYVRQEKSQRKHPVASSATSLIKAPVVPAAPKERPGWKGPGFTNKAPKQPSRPSPSLSTVTASNIQEQHFPIELQQLLFNIFRANFPACQDYERLKPILREIKDALSGRDFEQAFGRLDCLQAYAVRWSPNRALCYASVLIEICKEFREDVWVKHLIGGRDSEAERLLKYPENTARPMNIVCYGGGAAEVMAFGAMLRYVQPDAAGKPFVASGQAETVTESMSLLSIPGTPAHPPILDLHLVDRANWAPIVSSLQTGLATPPILSKYASASAKANNASFLAPGVLNTSFHQCNILEASQDELESVIGAEVALITLLFTLSDLHASSVAKSTAFLLKLTLAAPKNSLLLIVDSPESSSEAAIENNDQSKEKKSYPMRYLLDLVLMEKRLPKAVDDNPAWEKLVEDQSRLFKLEEGLKYPIGLENIRFQFYLFRKL
jgi:25S rRNA (uracil2843-N3)-methyltransferase